MGERIADELREWLRTEYGKGMANPDYPVDAYAIADRIDEAHDEAVSEAHDDGYREGVEWCRMHQETHSEAEIEAMGYVRLPVDADGKPWHVGDMADVNGTPCTISCIRVKRDGWSMVGNLADGSTWKCNDPSRATHHRLTPAEAAARIRAWVAGARADEHMDLRELEAVADEMEKSGGE